MHHEFTYQYFTSKMIVFFLFQIAKCTGTGPVRELNLGPLNLWAYAVPIELYGASNDRYGAGI